MNNCAFTICAKNYIGLAKVLEKSIKKYTNNIDFFIIIADEFDSNNITTEPNILIAKKILSIKEEKWNELAFKYDLTEFCTCIKPFVFKYMFNSLNYNKICYFDPDILFYSSSDVIYNKLNNCEILVTPHSLFLNNNEKNNIIEDEIRGNGIFNFGFLGLSRGQFSNNFLEWWGNKLLDKCFADPNKCLFTDQKWGDFLPVYFSSEVLQISRCLGWNVAPWNFEERKILFIENKYYVTERKNEIDKSEALVFVHFSGYDYKSLFSGHIQQRNRGHDIIYEDLNVVFKNYKEALLQEKKEIEEYLNKKYSYDYYSNSEKIELFHRRLFNGLLFNNINIGNPFDSNNKFFYLKIKKRKMFSKNNINIEKLTKFNMNKINKKLYVFNLFMRVIYKIFGYKNYLLLIKLLRVYSRYENQVHIIDSNKNLLY